MTRLRAHLARVDRGYVAFHTAAAILGGAVAIWFATDHRYGFSDTKNALWATTAAMAAGVAYMGFVLAVDEVARPNSAAAIKQLHDMEDRVAELDDELDATLDALRESDANVDRLTNERDDARADARDLCGPVNLDAFTQATSDVDEDIHAALSTPPPGWSQGGGAQ